MKFALFADCLPPSTEWAGQTSTLYRLLAPLDPETYVLVSRFAYDTDEHRRAPTRLPARYIHLPEAVPALPETAPRTLRVVHDKARRFANSAWLVRQLVGILRSARCDAVLCTTDRSSDLPAASLAARIVGIPCYAYLFDDYASKWSFNVALTKVTRAAEPFLLRGMSGLFVQSETLARRLEERYGLRACVIGQTFDLAAYEADRSEAPQGPLRIVFTGGISYAHWDAFRNLIAALDHLDTPAVLDLYTPVSRDELEEKGINGSSVEVHPRQDVEAMPRVQRSGHVLFLPLSFEREYRELVRTSAPSKIPEYLAARRPVLVHAPPDSFVSDYFRRHECGLVVDEPDPAKLAEALERLVSDPSLSAHLVENAWTRARLDYDLSAARERFARVLGVSTEAGAT